MTVQFFKQQIDVRPALPVDLPEAHQMGAANPKNYIADSGLVDAVNTALLLNQPLLLTGEPGTGKTQLASALAYQLGYSLWRFQAKSTTQARDLFYTYDALGHYRAPPGTPRLNYVQFQALGSAILTASPWEDVKQYFPEHTKPHETKASVVLIDEVDKAPRDFPNDILAELEDLHFSAPEIDVKVAAPRQRRPVVVVTSNSERDLPDAFLRRCVYYDIPFPGKDDLRKILAARLGLDETKGDQAKDFAERALQVFSELRGIASLRKKPATAELIAWMEALRRAYPTQENPLTTPDAALARLGVLIKSREDLEIAARTVRDCLSRKP